MEKNKLTNSPVGYNIGARLYSSFAYKHFYNQSVLISTVVIFVFTSK